MDFIEELKLRRWARLNYVAPDERDCTLPEIAADEMRIMDDEAVLRATNQPSFERNDRIDSRAGVRLGDDRWIHSSPVAIRDRVRVLS